MADIDDEPEKIPFKSEMSKTNHKGFLEKEGSLSLGKTVDKDI
jgi:hypothetical protein